MARKKLGGLIAFSLTKGTHLKTFKKLDKLFKKPKRKKRKRGW